MGAYELHKLIFDVQSKPAVKEAYLSEPDEVLQRYALSQEEVAALRTRDIYRLHKLGVSTYLLAPFARLLGYQLIDLGDILRAGAEAEQQRPSV